MFKKFAFGLCAASLTAISAASAATVFVETGDAGNTADTAVVLPTGSVDVFGVLDSDDTTGADLFVFTLLADAVVRIEGRSEAFDVNLLLFNSLRQGLIGDDDDDGNGCSDFDGARLDGCIETSLAAGTYYIAIGENNIGAFETEAEFLDGNGDFFDNDFGTLSMPTSQQFGFVGYEGGPDQPDAGDYLLSINVIGAAVPLPAASILFAGGLGLFGASARKKRRG